MSALWQKIYNSKWFWPALSCYIVGGMVMAFELNLHECDYPILRGILWPVPLIRFLCGVDF